MVWLLLLGWATAGCSDTALSPDEPLAALPGTSAAFALDGDWRGPTWLDHPWPSLARRAANGHLDPAQIPHAPRPAAKPDGPTLVDGLYDTLADRPGDSQIPVAYVRFDGALATRSPELVEIPGPSARLWLLALDRPVAEALPVVAQTLTPDAYAPAFTLALTPRPGFVLRPNARYAFVVLRGLGDAEGAPLGVPATLRNLLSRSQVGLPPGRADVLREPFAALRAALVQNGIAVDDVAAATVVQTADAFGELAALARWLRKRTTPSIQTLALDPEDGATHERFCELHGSIRLPQLQAGKPPFPNQGRFVLNADGAPIVQGEVDVPVVITLPKATMPDGGWPVVLYLHGTDGLSTQVVDRGPLSEPGGKPAVGKGPAHWLALHGLATVGVALPVNPERAPNAAKGAYINLANLAAFRDTIRQGVLEQPLVIDALATLQIPAATLAACAGPTLPTNAKAHRFAVEELGLLGQSQGGMYAYLVAAIEPRVRVVVPTGAGSLWSEYILITSKLPAAGAIAALLGTEAKLTWMHPAMSVLQTAWEATESLVAAPRLWRWPIDGAGRNVLQPVGMQDSFYPPALFDALALAIGHKQAGTAAWTSMQDALALDGRAGLLPYPVQATNIPGAPGAGAITSAVVQHPGDGWSDPHGIVYQDPGLQHQVGTFFATGLSAGVATLVGPTSEAPGP